MLRSHPVAFLIAVEGQYLLFKGMSAPLSTKCPGATVRDTTKGVFGVGWTSLHTPSSIRGNPWATVISG